jgi:DNA recombination protein RmuC
LQYKLKDGGIPDAVIRFPEPTGVVCVDSKFPLENYQRIIEATKNSQKDQIKEYEKAFARDVKNRINEVEKYIVVGETADCAILFIPSEAIFAQIVSYHPNLVEDAQRKKIHIASPTTLMAMCNAIHAIVMKIEVSKNAQIIKTHLDKLSTEFERYYIRWEKLEKQLQTVSNTTKEVGTTSDKIRSQFLAIKNMESTEKTNKIDHQSTEVLEIDSTNTIQADVDDETNNETNPTTSESTNSTEFGLF